MTQQRFLIAGGASGMGAAVVEALRSLGHNVHVLDRQATGHENDIVVDLRDAAATQEAVTQAVGEERLDGVVVTAGVGVFSSVAETTDRAWAAAIQHNLTAPFHVLRATIPRLADGASVVTVASTNAVAPLRYEGAYTAAKCGLVGLTTSLALELAPSARANVVSHGLIDTPFIAAITEHPQLSAVASESTPLGRVGTPQEGVALILFLLSDAASYITGQHFVVDGGGTLPRSQSDSIMRALKETRPQ